MSVEKTASTRTDQRFRNILVTGGAGFIGSHLVDRLVGEGCCVRAADIREPLFRASNAQEFIRVDLRDPAAAALAMHDIDAVFALAADMGGMGFISKYQASILRSNLLINLNTIEAARQARVQRYVFASSACVYPDHRQDITNVEGLAENMAFPAAPDHSYGWEKLTTELLCKHYEKDFGLPVRIARLHNIYGPLSEWTGERAKAPAALSAKVAHCKLTGTKDVEVWGDGNQTRSFCYVSDCVEGLVRVLSCGYSDPVNIGSEERVSIKELVGVIAAVSQATINIRYSDGPQGVRGRNSNNDLARQVLKWTPSVPLRTGIGNTYPWVEAQVQATLREQNARTT